MKIDARYLYGYLRSAFAHGSEDEVVKRIESIIPYIKREPRLYLEAHITVRPPATQSSITWGRFVESAQEQGWKASRFDVDEVDHYDGAWFLSNRSQNYPKLLANIQIQKGHLVEAGYEFIRAKIEDTLFDTKHGDIL